MDINRFEWSVVYPQPGWWKKTAKHLIFMSPFIMAIGYGIIYLSTHQNMVKANELIIAFLIIELAVVIGINQLIHLIEKAIGAKMSHYVLEEKGLKIDDKDIAMADLMNSAVEQVINTYELPYEQWQQPRPEDGTLLELTIPVKQTNLTLLFPEEYFKQKFLRTLKNYLHPQQ